LIESILEEFEMPNREEIMNQMYRLWGIPNPNQGESGLLTGQATGQGIPQSGGGSVSPSRPIPPPPPDVNNAEAQANISRLIAAGLR